MKGDSYDERDYNIMHFLTGPEKKLSTGKLQVLCLQETAAFVTALVSDLGSFFLPAPLNSLFKIVVSSGGACWLSSVL